MGMKTIHLLLTPDKHPEGVDAISACGAIVPRAVPAREGDGIWTCVKCLAALGVSTPPKGEVYLYYLIPGEIAKQEERESA